MKWLFIIVSLLMMSCSNSKQHEIGQYVYVDYFGTIHIDRQCASNLADNPKTKEERMANMQGVSFMDTCELTRYTGYYANEYDFCPRCIDDDAYRHLSAIMERNVVKTE